MDKDEKKTFAAVLNEWLMKNRIVLLVILGVIIASCVVFSVVYSVNKSGLEKKFNELDAISYELTQLMSDTDMEAEEKTAKEADVLAEITAFAGKNKKSAAGARAFMLAADVEFKNGNYENAKNYWLSGADANKKAYTAALCWYNAAICCDELNDYDAALANIDLAVSRDDFKLKPRALFNAGRIAEEKEDYELAAEYYNKANDSFAGDSWANLAKTRLISLEAEGKIE